MASTKFSVSFRVWLSSKLFTLLVEYIEALYLTKRYLAILWYFLNKFYIKSISLCSMRAGGYNYSYLFYSLIILFQNPSYFNSAYPLPKPRSSCCLCNYFFIWACLTIYYFCFFSSSALRYSSYFFLFSTISLNYFFKCSGPLILEAANTDRLFIILFFLAILYYIITIDFLFRYYSS